VKAYQFCCAACKGANRNALDITEEQPHDKVKWGRLYDAAATLRRDVRLHDGHVPIVQGQSGKGTIDTIVIEMETSARNIIQLQLVRAQTKAITHQLDIVTCRAFPNMRQVVGVIQTHVWR
jgi:hypothetical protein